MLNLLGVLLAFIIMILLIRRKYHFGLCLLLGALIVGVCSLAVTTPIAILQAVSEATIYSFEKQELYTGTIELALLMTLIFVLAKCMQDTGAITKLVESLRTILKKGGTLGVIPAVYGLMPVPGGALFSAPFIDQEGDTFQLQKNQKNFLNVWFRHIWFPIYPISSAMILICSQKFADLPIQMLMLADFPAFLVFVAVGMVYLRFSLRKTSSQSSSSEKNYSGLKYLLPPIIPLPFYFFTFVGVSETRCFLLGVIVGIVALKVLVKMDGKQYLHLIRVSLSWNLALAIVGIMIFREMITISQTPVFLRDAMSTLAFPALIIVILVPLLLGALTGYNLGAVALSYPLVESFFPLTGLTIIGLTSIIFMCSLLGYVISPIHLCNVVSSEYLKTDVTRMYKMYVPAVLVVLLTHIMVVLLVFHV